MQSLNAYWRSEKMENFVDEWIIDPLHNAIHAEIYFSMKVMQNVLAHCKEEGGMDVFHKKMRPYYRMFLEANPCMFQHGASYDVRYFILKAIPEDELFITWFAENFNLMDIVHAWAGYYDNSKSESREFMNLLFCLFIGGYECDWESCVKELRHILLRMEVEGNQYSRSIYSMFHGFVMISKNDCSLQKRKDLYELFNGYWFFLRFLYSAMFRCVIGCGFTNFVQIPNLMKSSNDYHPYLHLFYATAMEQKEEICRRGAKRDKLEASLEAIREIAQKEQSDKLDELCGILFPKVWKNYIDKHRPKSYRELENELESFKKEMNERVAQMNIQIQGMADQLKTMASASVPISNIADELQELPPGIAWEVFIQLNGMLVENEAWVKNAGEIRKKIRSRMKTSDKTTIHAKNVFEAGSSCYDTSKNITITNDKKQLE